MVVDRHHEVLDGVGVREQADGSIFFNLAMEILWEFRFFSAFHFLLFRLLRRAIDDSVIIHQRRSPVAVLRLNGNIDGVVAQELLNLAFGDLKLVLIGLCFLFIFLFSFGRVDVSQLFSASATLELGRRYQIELEPANAGQPGTG